MISDTRHFIGTFGWPAREVEIVWGSFTRSFRRVPIPITETTRGIPFLPARSKRRHPTRFSTHSELAVRSRPVAMATQPSNKQLQRTVRDKVPSHIRQRAPLNCGVRRHGAVVRHRCVSV